MPVPYISIIILGPVPNYYITFLEKLTSEKANKVTSNTVQHRSFSKVRECCKEMFIWPKSLIDFTQFH